MDFKIFRIEGNFWLTFTCDRECRAYVMIITEIVIAYKESDACINYTGQTIAKMLQ